MIRYYFRGFEVPREGALKAWRASGTYKRANLPDSIFAKAEAGIEDGGVMNHLAEAGIRIAAVSPSLGAVDGGDGG